jgi:uncharacterized protein (TIGR03067 family)
MRGSTATVTAALTVLLAATFLVGEDQGKQGADAASDKKALKGTWQTATSEMDGERQPEDDVRQYKVVVEGDKLSIMKSGEVFMAGTYTLDTGPKPRHIDLKLAKNEPNPDDVGKTLPGIYEVSEDDLKWCFALSAAAERPKGFGTTSGSELVNATLKREKAKK